MATPTAMKHASSQQGRTPAGATPPVSTPFSSSHVHAAFSPLGPRSSPQNMKKSPANSATLMGHTASSSGIPGGGGGGGGGSSSGGGPGSVPAMSYDSPAAAAAMGALALDLGGLDHVGVGGLAHLGAMGRNDDDERARRLQAVLDMLRQSKGRVSEAGLERLAKAMGLECLWEEAMGGGGSKARTLIIAGSALALEIAVANNIVESVSVTFPESRSIVLRHVERADQILLADLQLRPDESPLTKTLDRFAANLEALAALDRLSVEPGLNLYEAVAGLYETLDRLYQWDLQQLRADPAHSGQAEDALALVAQCARHGRPTMHEHGHLGLGVDYWRRRRLVRPRQPSSTNAAAVTSAAADETTWSILVGCAPIGNALVYQPVRVSDKWLSDAIVKEDQQQQQQQEEEQQQQQVSSSPEPELDWLEPENTILASKEGADGEGAGAAAAAAAEAAATGLAGAKLPDVRFHASFQPPVAVPFAVWHQINELVGLVPEAEALVTFDALYFPVPPGTQHDPSEPRTIRCDKDVYVRPRGAPEGGDGGGGGPSAVPHRHTLFVYKPVYGRVLSELPFAHPSQLVRMLPTLRQYAFLATLLETGFDAKRAGGSAAEPVATPAAAPATTATPSPRASNGQGRSEVLATVDDEFARYTGGPAGAQRAKAAAPRAPGAAAAAGRDADRVHMDVVLTAHPAPRLQVVFPFRDATADVVLEIGPNAQVHVVSQNILEEGEEGAEGAGSAEDMAGGTSKGKGKGKGRRLYPQDLGRMLEVCEDLGIWCEWIRSRCA